MLALLTRSSWLTAICGALLTGDALGGELAPVTLPVAPQGVKDKNDDPDARLVLNLTKDGEVLVDRSEIAFGDKRLVSALKLQPGFKPINLDRLGFHFSGTKRMYDFRQRRKGASGYERSEGGAEISRLFVLLRADKDAPWIHVEWLLQVMMEHKLHKLQFAVKAVADRSYSPEEATLLGAKRVDVAPPTPPALESKLSVFLPTHHPEVAFAKIAEIRVEIHTGVETTVKEWGKFRHPASVPTEVRYEIGGRKTQNLADLDKWIAESVANARKNGKRPVWQIKVGAKVQVKYVIAVLDRMYAAGAKKIWFFDRRIPQMELRELPYLPYPK